MSPKPARTIHIDDKGSNYILLDSDDITQLYHVHWNTITLPHMTVTSTDAHKSNLPIGTANFIPTKTGGFATADRVSLTLHGHQTFMTKSKPSDAASSSVFSSWVSAAFSTDKRYFTTSRGRMCWKGGVAASGFLKLQDSEQNTVATYKNTAYDGRRMGKIEIYADPLTQQELDEIVISGLAMISEQKVGMGQTAANLASAGAMG